MTKYVFPLILSTLFATPTYACGCLPLTEEPPTKYVPFTVTSVKDGLYTAIGKKDQVTFKNDQITNGNELFKGDIILIKESNNAEHNLLGVELFIPHDQVETE